MLEPIETWTRKSLQFQPPDTQPSGVSTQPFVPSTRRTTRPVAIATIQAGASARRARREPRPGRSFERGEPATPDEREPDAGERQEHGRHDDRCASEAADPRDDVHQVGRDVDAGDDRGSDRTRDRQARHDPPDDDPARDEEQDRPDEDDRAQRHRPGDEAADEDGEQDRADGDGGRRLGAVAGHGGFHSGR